MTNVQFTLSDFELMPFKANIILTPNVNIQVSADSLIPNVPKKQWDDGTTVTFNCLPGIYIVNINGPQYNDESTFGDFSTRKTPSKYSGRFTINVLETGGGTVNANTLIVDQCFTLPTSSFNVISASYANTASYASNAGSSLSYVSGLYSFGQNGVSVDYIEVSHGLGITPSYVNLVVVCVTNDAQSGMQAGDEVPASQWMDTIDTAPAFSYGANSSTLWATTALTGGDYPNGIGVVQKSVGDKGNISSVSNFRLKFYARL